MVVTIAIISRRVNLKCFIVTESFNPKGIRGCLKRDKLSFSNDGYDCRDCRDC